MYLLTIIVLPSQQITAQFVVHNGNIENAISIHTKAEYVDVGLVDVSFEQIKSI